MAGGAGDALEIEPTRLAAAQQALDQDLVGLGLNAYAFGPPLAVCRALAKSGLPFDQVIEEGGWTHISFDPRGRRQVLTKLSQGYQEGLSR